MQRFFSIRNSYFFTALCIFVYLIIRAICIPPVHDEAATYIHYIQQGQWLPFKAHWDANNHILNSFLSGIIFKIFGIGNLYLRLASLLFFPLYVFYVYKISKSLKSSVIQIGFLCGMLGVHNLIEYFAYSRGYAMSMALLMATIYYLMVYFKDFNLKKLIPFYFFAFLGLFANLTLFNTMLIMHSLVFFSFILKNKNWFLKFVFIIAGVIPMVLATFVTLQMKELGLLYYGGNKSFYHVTVATVSLLMYGNWCTPLAVAFVIISGIGIIFLLMAGVKEGVKNILFTQRWFFALLFLGNILGTVLLQKLMHVNYPEDRTAMYFYFLLVLFVCFCVDAIQFKPIKYFSFIWMIAPVYFIFQINITHSSYWFYEHIPNTFYQEVNKRTNGKPWEASIGGYNLMDMIWAYNNQQNGGLLNDIQVADYPSFYYDYLILYNDENYQKSKNDYTEILSSPYSNIKLLERKQKVNMELITSYSHPNHQLDTNEYFNFFVSDSLNRYPNLCFDIEADVSCPNGFLFGYISAGTFNKEEAGPHEWMAFHHFRSSWSTPQHFHHRLFLKGILPTASRSVCYLWNPKNLPINLLNCKVKVFGFNY